MSNNLQLVKGLISIVTPCYNTGGYIHRLFDSLLLQDYPMVEMIVVNDGSTDNTYEVIQSYIPKFQDKGYKLICICQKNAGQSSAIRNGLKYVSGEYLIWPDSDDFYNDKTALSKFVKVFIEKPQVAVVRCLISYIDERTLKESNRLEYTPERQKSDLFYDCLFGTNGFFFGAGNYMIRLNIFDKVVPNRDIYFEKECGQNYQILLPVLYHRECWTLCNAYLSVLERSDSHSRGHFNSYEKLIEKFNAYERCATETVKRLMEVTEDERDEHLRHIHSGRLFCKMCTSIDYYKREEAITYYNELLECGKASERKISRYLLSHFCYNKYTLFAVRTFLKITGLHL